MIYLSALLHMFSDLSVHFSEMVNAHSFSNIVQAAYNHILPCRPLLYWLLLDQDAEQNAIIDRIKANTF